MSIIKEIVNKRTDEVIWEIPCDKCYKVTTYYTNCYSHIGLDVIIGWKKPILNQRPIHHLVDGRNICNDCYNGRFHEIFKDSVDHDAWYREETYLNIVTEEVSEEEDLHQRIGE